MASNNYLAIKLKKNKMYVIGDPIILTNEIYHAYILSIKDHLIVLNNNYINIPIKTTANLLYDTSNASYLNFSGIFAVIPFFMLKDEYQMDMSLIDGAARILYSNIHDRNIIVDSGRIKIYNSKNTSNDKFKENFYICINGSMIANLKF